MTTADEIFTSLETAYAERLAKRATEWQVRYPDEAKTLREAIDAQYRRPGMTEPEKGSLQWQMIEAAVVEAIRAKKGWPTLREYERLQGGLEPSPPMVRLHIVPPAVERVDHKAKAAGES
jgi:hypothetical protein